MIRVRVVAASPALRAGLASMLASDPEISVRDQTHAADVANGSPTRESVDVVISASPWGQPPDGGPLKNAQVLPTLYLQNDPIDVRALDTTSAPWGILPLDASAAELQAAVRALAAGLLVAAPPLMSTSGDGLASGGPLTDRETEVLTLLSRGLANKQIAVTLGISEHTVKFHVSSIYTKLNATNRTQAVREGLRNGWIAL